MLALEATVHSLMTYSFVLFLVLILKASELAAAELLPSGGRKGALVFFANLALCAALVWGNFCVTNTAYLRMQVRYETSYAVANRVMARIESLEGYTPDTPVAIAGILPSGQYGTGVGDFARIDGLTGVEDNALLGTYAASVFLKTYTGLHMPGLTDEQWLMVYQSGILDTMPSYPPRGPSSSTTGWSLSSWARWPELPHQTASALGGWFRPGRFVLPKGPCFLPAVFII